MAIADLQTRYKIVHSQTIPARPGIDNENAVSKGYCIIHQGVRITISRPQAAAIVIQPFVVELTPREGGYLATSDISNGYELGVTFGQVLRNYLEFLVDELFWLQKNEEQLSPSIQEDLHRLQSYLRIV